MGGKQHSFSLLARYEETLAPEHLALLRIASVMPVLNYGLFAKEIKLKFPVSRADASLLNDMLDVFSKDIFINKLGAQKKPLHPARVCFIRK